MYGKLLKRIKFWYTFHELINIELYSCIIRNYHVNKSIVLTNLKTINQKIFSNAKIRWKNKIWSKFLINSQNQSKCLIKYTFYTQFVEQHQSQKIMLKFKLEFTA